MQRIRIKEKVFFEGKVYGPGDILTLPDGIKGPHRAISRNEDRIDYGTNPPIDANRRIGDIEDVPLYDVLDGSGPMPHDQIADDLAKLPAAKPAPALATLEGLIGLLTNPEATKKALAEIKQKQDDLTALHQKVIAAGTAHQTKEAELSKRAAENASLAQTLTDMRHALDTQHLELSARAAALDQKQAIYEANAKSRDAEHTKLRQTLADETAAANKKLAEREAKIAARERAAEAKADETNRREAAVSLREHNVQSRIDELSQHLRPL